MFIISYLAQLAKPLTGFFAGLIGGLLIRRNQELKQETKDQQKFIAIQKKVINVSQDNKRGINDDAVERMCEEKL